jgi:ribosomal protein L37AE/L43A
MIKCPRCLVSINKERHEAADWIKCLGCNQWFNNESAIPTTRLVEAISLISIKTKGGEEMAKMIANSIGSL